MHRDNGKVLNPLQTKTEKGVQKVILLNQSRSKIHRLILIYTITYFSWMNLRATTMCVLNFLLDSDKGLNPFQTKTDKRYPVYGAPMSVGIFQHIIHISIEYISLYCLLLYTEGWPQYLLTNPIHYCYFRVRSMAC